MHARGWSRRAAALVLLLALSTMAACRGARPPYVPRDPALRRLPLFFYPATTPTTRAYVVFFGNDVGFWDAHDRLARRLADNGYDVVGVDVKRVIDGLPSTPGARARAFADSATWMIARSAHELGSDTLPLVLAGHSYGADLALWLAATRPPPRLVGVLALGPTARSHFYVTMLDRANVRDPTEPGSFSIASEIAAVSPTVRIALVRGESDHRAPIDSSLRAAGGARLHYTVIPLAGHSLKSLTIAGPMIEHALGWLVPGQ